MSSIDGVRLNGLAEVEQRQTPQTAETPNAVAPQADDAGRGGRLGELFADGVNARFRLLSEAAPQIGPPAAPDLSTQASVRRVGGRIVIDAGAGDDNVQITRNAAGGVTVNVNGAERTFTGADANRLTIRAGNGNDTINVAPDVTVRLTLEGGDGNDTIRGGGGNDRILGGGGDDTIEAAGGNDTVYGGAGRDYLNGSVGNDRLYGGTGDDVVYGGDGNDSIQGNAGNDYLEGSRGNDNVLGGAGRDVLSGGLGDDTLRGGDGNDVLYAGGGTDRLYGDRGSNTLYAQSTDTTQASNARRNVRNTFVEVVLAGNPGGTAVTVNGSAEFRERVEADLEMLRSSPLGRQMLTSFDTSGHTVTIEETADGNSADWTRRTTGGPHPFLNPATGATGPADDSTIGYNTSRISLPGPDAWRRRPPVVGLFHEMAHAYDITHGTFQPGTYNGVDAADHGINNNEREATGLRVDHDNDPTTPERTVPQHPDDLTENAFRRELGQTRRGSYS